jgi:hypothetical protein
MLQLATGLKTGIHTGPHDGYSRHDDEANGPTKSRASEADQDRQHETQ